MNLFNAAWETNDLVGDIGKVLSSLNDDFTLISDNIMSQGAKDTLMQYTDQFVPTLRTIERITHPNNLQKSVERIRNRTSWDEQTTMTFVSMLRKSADAVLRVVAPKTVVLKPHEKIFEAFLDMILDAIELMHGDKFVRLNKIYQESQSEYDAAKRYDINVARGRMKGDRVPTAKMETLRSTASLHDTNLRQASVRIMHAEKHMTEWLTKLAAIVPNIIVSAPHVNDIVISDALKALREGDSLGFTIPRDFSYEKPHGDMFGTSTSVFNKSVANAPSSSSEGESDAWK
jgi:hypothetical protein